MSDCACIDPLKDECYLVYPCPEFLASGPLNRLRGEKLIAMYQQEEHFKGRMMLVDSDLLNFFRLEPEARMVNRHSPYMPSRLEAEYDKYKNGYEAGPLIEQENLFDHLWKKNSAIKRKISEDMLQETLCQKFENNDAPFFCYCYANMPSQGPGRKDVIECAHRNCSLRYFHKSCVKKLATEKVSRWYCTVCEGQMRTRAHQILHEFDHDAPNVDSDVYNSLAKFKEDFKVDEETMEMMREKLKTIEGAARVADIIAKTYHVAAARKFKVDYLVGDV